MGQIIQGIFTLYISIQIYLFILILSFEIKRVCIFSYKFKVVIKNNTCDYLSYRCGSNFLCIFFSLIDRRGIYTEEGQLSQRYHYGTVKGAQSKVNFSQSFLKSFLRERDLNIKFKTN